MKEETNRQMDENLTINNNINFRTILLAIYLTLYKRGYETISLKVEDIEKYIKNLESIFDDYNINSEDLFIRTPVLETYDRYGDYLMQLFLSINIGYMNEKYDTIIINCKDFFIKKFLEQKKEYNAIINDCCKAIIGEDYNDAPISENGKINQKIKN